MPTYRLPPLKKRDHDEANETMPAPMHMEFPDRWDRQVRIPVDSKLLQAAAVGDEVEITLRGRVSATQDEQREEGANRTVLELEIEEVSMYADDGSSAADDFAKGFKRGPKRTY